MEHDSHIHSDRINEANVLLTAAGALGARWWHYTASLNSFELVVGEPSGANNLVLVLASCMSLAGPTSWNTQRLRVRAEPSSANDSGTTIFELRDDSVGFVARSNIFTFKQGWNLLEAGSVMFPHGWRAESS